MAVDVEVLALVMSGLALVISIAGYVLQRQERRSGVRAGLHGEWVKAIKEQADSFGELMASTKDIYRGYGYGPVVEAARAQWTSTFQLTTRNSLVLPSEVTNAAYAFLDAVKPVFRANEHRRDKANPPLFEELKKNAQSKYGQWFDVARKSIGVEIVDDELRGILRQGMFG